MPNPPALTRRTALASLVVAGGFGLSGCTFGSIPKTHPAPANRKRPDPDVAIAARALAAERETLALLVAAAKRHRPLRAALAPMIAAHRAHVDLLAAAAPDVTTAGPSAGAGGAAPSERLPVPADPGKALAALAKAEQRLGGTLERQAVAARSGQFARLLASMSAASSQHAAILSTTAVPAGRR